jgi:hypothetical protein
LNSVASSSGATASEFDQAMAQLESQIGINPNKDLFPYLDGEFMLAGMPSTEGALQSAHINLGAAAIIETSDSKKVKSAVDKVVAAVKEQAGLSITPKSAGDLSYYSVTEPQSKIEMLAAGVGKQYLVFGTSSSLVEGLFNGKSSLTNSKSYQNAIKVLPNGSYTSIYIDVQGLLATIRKSMTGSTLQQFDQTVKVLGPIPAVVAGGSAVGQNMVRSTIVIIVTPVK